ncbi:cupin domain-containing protein [Microvirga zambiensis]|uniref:cupin domain-containing protein n=1 Tax=Microvirga zambiensis TaxID=1402137 RepID=UPI00191E26F5|nr:cupin domain-containing protein [Microvirga zambiensis]
MASESNKGVPLAIRRVVTGHDRDRSAAIALDAPPPRTDAFQHIPGMISRLVWATPSVPAHPPSSDDPTLSVTSFVPGPGETRFLVITFPPDSVFFDPNFNPNAAAAENLAVSPGLAELFEPDGKHVTPTVDYGIVLDGEIWLELERGQETLLRPFDVFVQNGTRHAWRNKSDRPATLAVVLIGAQSGT